MLYDITRPLRTGMPVWPGDAPCRLRWTGLLSRGNLANTSELALSVHTGTHADGPYHVLEDGPRIGAAPLEAFLGPALLVDAPPALDEAWAAALVEAERPERLLVRTGCWAGGDDFPTTFPAPAAAAARRLARGGLRLFGTDAPSVDLFDAGSLEVHRVLCREGIGILENLLLDGVPPGSYELIALPLRLEEGDGSPVRAVLRG